MKKNNVIMWLIGATGVLFTAAVLSNDIEVASRLGGVGFVTGVSALFVTALIKEKKTEE